MSTRAFGSASRSFITGKRLWPPARTFASPPKRSSSWTASSTDEGAKYSNRGGIIPQPPVLSKSAPSSLGRDKGFSPETGPDRRTTGCDSFCSERRAGLEIRGAQKQVHVPKCLPHSRRRGFEPWIVGVGIHPDDEMA